MENKTLYEHVPHVHFPRNINRLAEAERMAGTFNQKLAVAITNGVGTMACAYLFLLLAIIGFPGFHATPTAYVQWLSQTVIQLVMLSILAVGQKIIGRKQELQAEEAYQTELHSFHDVEQMRIHQDAQDAKIIEMHDDIQRLIALVDKPARKKTEALK